MYTEYRKTGKKELFLRSQEIKEKEIKGKSDFNELTKANDLISGKFDNYESEKREKYKAIKDLKVHCLVSTSLLKMSKINSIVRKSIRVEIVY